MSGMFASASTLARAALAVVRKAEWDESQHPRDARGRFGDTDNVATDSDAPWKNQPRSYASDPDDITQAPQGSSFGHYLLNDAQNRAAELYANTFAQKNPIADYKSINEAASGRMPTYHHKYEASLKAAADLQQAVDASTLREARTFFRGANLPATLKEGDIIEPRGFVSSSSSLDQAVNFANTSRSLVDTENTQTILRIQAPAGTPVLQVNTAIESIRPEEEEHVFGANQRFQVVSESSDHQGMRRLTVVPIAGGTPVRKAAWDESQHPRDDHGRFGEGEGVSAAPSNTWRQKLADEEQQQAVNAYIEGAEINGVHVGPTRMSAVLAGNYDHHSQQVENEDLVKAHAENLRNARLLSAAIDSSHTTTAQTLYRGSRIPKGLTEGQVITSKGFTSTSREKEVAKEFIEESQFTNGESSDTHEYALMRVQTPAGTQALDLDSAIKGTKYYAGGESEMEVLFGHDTAFKIVKDHGLSKKGYRLLTVRPVKGVQKAAWDESQHPRDENGRFGTTGGGKEVVGGRAAGDYADYTESDHLDASKHYSYAALTLRGGAKKEANRLAREHADAAARVGRASANKPAGQATSGAQNDRSSPQIKLSKAQTDSIREYIGNDDAAGINAVLRGQDAHDYDAEEQAHFLSLGRNISQAAADNPLTRSETLYRASYMPPGLKSGSVVATGSLLSATTDKSVADEFFSSDIEFRPGMSLITIRAAAGSLALNTNAVAGLKHEHAEHIVASNQPLHIVSVKTRTDADKNVYRIIEAELRPPKVSKAACDQREQT